MRHQKIQAQQSILTSNLGTSLGLTCAAILGAQTTHAAVLYGLDAKAESSSGAGDATFNEATGSGVDISNPSTLSNWITVTSSPTPATSLTPTFNTASGQVNINTSPTGQYALTMTYKVDLTGSHDVTFDKFAVAFQRGGATSSNVVSDALYSTDGTNFSPATVAEVAVGLNNGTDNVGPADTITSFRTPDGLGGTIGPQQVYVVSGLGAAGSLNSGSFYIRLTVGAPSNNQTNLTMLTDRNDLTTDAMALSANNTTDLGADDGYDIAWFGSATAVPEPSIALLSTIGIFGILRRRR